MEPTHPTIADYVADQRVPSIGELLSRLTVPQLLAFDAKFNEHLLARQYAEGVFTREGVQEAIADDAALWCTDAERSKLVDELHMLLSEASAASDLEAKLAAEDVQVGPPGAGMTVAAVVAKYPKAAVEAIASAQPEIAAPAPRTDAERGKPHACAAPGCGRPCSPPAGRPYQACYAPHADGTPHACALCAVRAHRDIKPAAPTPEVIPPETLEAKRERVMGQMMGDFERKLAEIDDGTDAQRIATARKNLRAAIALSRAHPLPEDSRVARTILEMRVAAEELEQVLS